MATTFFLALTAVKDIWLYPLQLLPQVDYAHNMLADSYTQLVGVPIDNH